MPTTNGSRMSFSSQSRSRKTAAAASQKRQRLALAGCVMPGPLRVTAAAVAT